VLDFTEWSAHQRPDVLGPFPTRLVGGPSNREAAKSDDFELTSLEFASFVRMLESPQDDFVHNCPIVGAVYDRPMQSKLQDRGRS